MPQNVNQNTNTINVNVGNAGRRQGGNRKKKPGWLYKTIVGGIVALLLSLAGYYFQQKMDDKARPGSGTIDPGGPLSKGEKQN